MLRRTGVVLALGPIFILGSAMPVWAQGTTERVSISSGGAQGNTHSYDPVISADGRFVAFGSDASNLVRGDTNDWFDIFLHDRQTGHTQRVSIGSGGVQGNGGSGDPVISPGGRFIAFMSLASNLVPGDTNEQQDVFVRDRQTGTTERLNVSTAGAQGNGFSFQPTITPGGRFAAFVSAATNLVPSDTNNQPDIFVRDRQTGTTRRVSISSSGGQANGQSFDPAISRDGRFVAFMSDASNLVPGDTNNLGDVFVRDRQTGTTKRVSVSSGGGQSSGGASGDPAISPDGRFVVFLSFAINLVSGDTNSAGDVFVHDRRADTTRRVSVGAGGGQGNEQSFDPTISPDGRFVAFVSAATNLVPNDTNGQTDIFLRDRQTGKTRRISVSAGGAQGNNSSDDPAISPDGRFVAFGSLATNLAPSDTNNASDVFVHVSSP